MPKEHCGPVVESVKAQSDARPPNKGDQCDGRRGGVGRGIVDGQRVKTRGSRQSIRRRAVPALGGMPQHIVLDLVLNR